MKKFFFNVIFLILLCFTFIFSKDILSTKSNKHQNKVTKKGSPARGILHNSKWLNWIYNNGQSNINPDGQSGGLYLDQRVNTIFQDGFVWGGIVRGAAEKPMRVGGQTYFVGTVPGRILSPGISENPDEPHIRIYKVHRNYNNLSDIYLKKEAGELNRTHFMYIDQTQIDELRLQYSTDWEEWPSELGAPYTDINNDGYYDPAIDIPGIRNADITIWLVINDLNDEVCEAMYGSPPMGIEAQITLWGFDRAEAMEDVLYKRCRIINKSTSTIDSMFISLWSDTDIGESGNDFVGCNMEKEMGYGYNSEEWDNRFDAYDLKPAAVGYDLLQGPIIHTGLSNDTAIYNFQKLSGYKNLPMTSFSYFSAGSPFADPEERNYENGTFPLYNMLNGRPPVCDTSDVPYYIVGSGLNQGDSTLFPLGGDPVLGMGDIDGQGYNLSSGDRRMVLSSGPFTMNPGDSQEIVFAIIGGYSDDGYLESITDMFENDSIAQVAYNSNFSIIPTNICHTVNYREDNSCSVYFKLEIKHANYIKLTIKNYNEQIIDSLVLYDDGLHEDNLANDGIWGNMWETSTINEGLKADLDVSFNDSKMIFNEIFKKITTSGPLKIINFEIVKDYYNNDKNPNPGEKVEYKIDIKNDGNHDLTSISVYLSSLIYNDFEYNPYSSFVIECDLQSRSIFEYEDRQVLTPDFFTVPTALAGDDSIYLVFKMSNFNHNLWHDTIAVWSPMPEPLKFEITQNYPNPFNESTKIDFIYPLDNTVEAQLCIYNILGQNVKVINQVISGKGLKTFSWNGKNKNNQQLTSGIYFTRIKVGSYTGSIKILYLK